MSDKTTGELAKAVCAVMAEVRNVEKTGYNSFGKYKYASDADLLRALQPAMSKNGLALIPIRVERENDKRTNNRGKEEDRADVLVTYLLLHTSGESLELQAPGTGMDSLDKAIYKAMTGALKYALRGLALVPTGDDPEKDQRQQPRKDREATKSPQWRAFEAAVKAAGLDRNDFRDWFEAEFGCRPDTLNIQSLERLAGEVSGMAPAVMEFSRATGGAR